MKEKLESLERMLYNEKINLEGNLKKSHLTGENKSFLEGRLLELKNSLNHIQQILKD